MNLEQESLKIARLQREIEAYLSLGETTLLFDFQDYDRTVRLNLITVNPRHRQSFLFHWVEGRDRLDCMEQMYEYIQTYRDKRNSYTIQWTAKGESELHTSYFRAKDIPEALEKLQFGRDPNSLIIFSVVLNPIS
ncbi:hypothetical protein GC167_08865 [bacterium]|nr:hypothetical protein [bacterium]